MCGITGYQGEFARDLLDAMTAAVAHRGPDGSGALICDRCNCRSGQTAG
jgi:asparagine synthetase B (glutamine-hydrolysing)